MPRESAKTENDPRFGRIIRRHLHFDPVTHHETNEPLSHFTRDMGKDFVPTGQGNLEHRPSENRRNSSFDLYRLLLIALVRISIAFVDITTSAASASAAASSEISWSSDNLNRFG